MELRVLLLRDNWSFGSSCSNCGVLSFALEDDLRIAHTQFASITVRYRTFAGDSVMKSAVKWVLLLTGVCIEAQVNTKGTQQSKPVKPTTTVQHAEWSEYIQTVTGLTKANFEESGLAKLSADQFAHLVMFIERGEIRPRSVRYTCEPTPPNYDKVRVLVTASEHLEHRSHERNSAASPVDFGRPSRIRPVRGGLGDQCIGDRGSCGRLGQKLGLHRLGGYNLPVPGGVRRQSVGRGFP